MGIGGILSIDDEGKYWSRSGGIIIILLGWIFCGIFGGAAH